MTDLNHFNRDKSIKGFFELCGNFAVIEKVYANAPLETGCFNSFFRESFLLDRERQAVDFTAVAAGSLG